MYLKVKLDKQGHLVPERSNRFTLHTTGGAITFETKYVVTFIEIVFPSCSNEFERDEWKKAIERAKLDELERIAPTKGKRSMSTMSNCAEVNCVVLH